MKRRHRISPDSQGGNGDPIKDFSPKHKNGKVLLTTTKNTTKPPAKHGPKSGRRSRSVIAAKKTLIDSQHVTSEPILPEPPTKKVERKRRATSPLNNDSHRRKKNLTLNIPKWRSVRIRLRGKTLTDNLFSPHDSIWNSLSPQAVSSTSLGSYWASSSSSFVPEEQSAIFSNDVSVPDSKD
ncbi:hypothetical protein O181_025167 [Austropuccinia psidii MF-1]|uniref:Uncharacterized protein n=1 Tax=Austropuccinia psidii MF-1 TaxID=1389203 RepID=A0A9Q3CKN1_9BASI|nr:hypothetical protein [Austropuccinia psidii MF-1]